MSSKKESSPLAANLKRLRENRGLTQAQLAAILNIETGTVSGYERGYRKPSSDTIFALSQCFEISVDDLLGIGETNSEPSISDSDRDLLKSIHTLSSDDQNRVRMFIDSIKKSST